MNGPRFALCEWRPKGNGRKGRPEGAAAAHQPAKSHSSSQYTLEPLATDEVYTFLKIFSYDSYGFQQGYTERETNCKVSSELVHLLWKEGI